MATMATEIITSMRVNPAGRAIDADWAMRMANSLGTLPSYGWGHARATRLRLVVCHREWTVGERPAARGASVTPAPVPGTRAAAPPQAPYHGQIVVNLSTRTRPLATSTI